MAEARATDRILKEVAGYCTEADALVRAGNPDEAMRRLNFALDTLRNQNAPRAQAGVLEGFARVQRSVGRISEAESSVRAALACYLRVDDRGEEARMLGELASLRISQGHLEDGGYWLHSSLRVLVELGNRAGQADIHRLLATLHLRMGELDLALTHVSTAVQMFLDLADELGEARTLGVLAQVHMRTGDYAAAHKAADRALAQFRKHGHRPGISSVTMVSAAILRREGRMAEAEKLLLQTLVEKQDMKDRAGEAGVLNTLGIVVMDGEGDRLAEAERHFLRAIEIYEELHDGQNAALSLTNLAQVYQMQGRASDAETVQRDAIERHRASHARESEMRALRGLGSALAAQGKLDEAMAAYDEALSFARGFGDDALLAECLASWADLMLLRGRSDDVARELDADMKGARPTAAVRVIYLVPVQIRLALARRDVSAAAIRIREGELALGQLEPEARTGLRAGLNAAIGATDAAAEQEVWPLFHGFLPSELPAAQRKALLAEADPATLSESVVAAMQSQA